MSTGGSMLTIPILPKTGTYTVIVTPPNGSAASFEATFDPGIPLVVDGPAQTVSTSVQGKGIRFVIDAIAGQKLGIGLTNVTVTGSTGFLSYTLYAPDGTDVSASSCNPAATPGCEIDLGPIPVAGRYALTIQPPAAALGMSVKAQATNDVVVAASSTPQALVVSRDGGNSRVTLQGVPGAGQTIFITDFAATPTGKHAVISVRRPDGRTLNASTPLYAGLEQSATTGTIKIGDFPIEGPYDVFIDPRDAAQVSLKAQVSSGVDIGGQVPVHVDVVPGPWARTVFAGSVGDHKAIGLDVASLTNPTGSSLSLSVFDPNGQAVYLRGTTTLVSTCSTSYNGCDFDLPDLLIPGNYQVLAELPVAKPEDASVQLTVSSDIVIQGLSGAFNLASRGQNGRLLFNGTAGHSPQITATRVSPTGTGRDVILSVYAPDGTMISQGALAATATSRNLAANNIPLTGEYMLYIDPSNGYQTEINVTVSSP
jgi:hypothetical protein